MEVHANAFILLDTHGSVWHCFTYLKFLAQGHREDLATPGTGSWMSLVHLCRVILPLLIAKQ